MSVDKVDTNATLPVCGAPECAELVFETGLCAVHVYRYARQVSRDRRAKRAGAPVAWPAPTPEHAVLRHIVECAPPVAIVAPTRVRPRRGRPKVTRPHPTPPPREQRRPPTPPVVLIRGPLLTTGDVARLLGVSLTTVRRALLRGAVPYQRTPGGNLRVRRDDADAWVRKLANPADPA